MHNKCTGVFGDNKKNDILYESLNPKKIKD
jgi:hypothetical protein